MNKISFEKSIGFRLMNEAEKVVRKNGFNECNLEVYINNYRAIAFYKSKGISQ